MIRNAALGLLAAPALVIVPPVLAVAVLAVSLWLMLAEGLGDGAAH
jgi:hypothetical protein